MNYEFKRYFYKELEKAIQDKKMTVLVGPRKTGKSTALKQLEKQYDNSVYIDFKSIENELDKIISIYNDINSSLQNQDGKIYLLDEFTHAFKPDMEFQKIEEEYAIHENNNVTIIFTGSQSTAIENWAMKYFSGMIRVVRCDFINYAEWLDYKKINIVNEETYQNFLYEVRNFHKIDTIEEYLKSCIDETIESNFKNENYNYFTDIDDVTVESLIDICYLTLFTLHNNVTYQTFIENNRIKKNIVGQFEKTAETLGTDEIERRIQKSYLEKYNELSSHQYNAVKQSLLFLNNCNMITLTPITDGRNGIPNLWNEILTDKYENKKELFKNFNVTIKYPMFYISIIEEILKDDMPKELPKSLLGSIIECHLRGLLTKGTCYEYNYKRMENDKLKESEVDFVNPAKKVAIEFTKGIKGGKELFFNELDKSYANILLTPKKFRIDDDNFALIPYYDFIYAASYAYGKNEDFEYLNDEWLLSIDNRQI